MRRLCELYLGIFLTTEEKARETLSQGSRKVPVAHDSMCQRGREQLDAHLYWKWCGQ